MEKSHLFLIYLLNQTLLMKRIFLPCAFLLASTFLFAQSSKVQEQAIIVKTQIQRNHYNPKAINDSFSSEMFSKIIKDLDPQQNIFTADDYAALSVFRYKLDDELNGGSWKFLDVVSNLYKKDLKRADSLVNSILQKPLDFTTDDKITFLNDESVHFATSITELRSKWTKWFKFLLLDALYDMQQSDSAKQPFKLLLVKEEPTLRERIRKLETKNIESILEPPAFDNSIKEIYLNAFTKTFDPHTDFFSLQEKENFQSELSTENFSFGFDVDETKEGKIIIAELTPGGPAWKSGELHVNDELLELQWEGKPAVNVSTISSEEISKLLNESNHGSITLKIKKTNGAVKTISLQKEKIETQENVVKGYLLKGEKNIGYISLPGFYTKWEDEKGSGCANDMAKEIIKLKRENIEGLILDVRFNGGGSLGEALQMAGIFIDEGPLVGIKSKTGKLVFLKDPNRGTIYDGPMILMVNGQSASASEMLAAALQDYNRAIIVGSPTYGKATMQQIFPMDTITSDNSVASPDGFIKITTGKLYRVSGQTAQLNGVTPDVRLPDAFDALHYREKFTPDALPSDTVKKNSYYQALPALPVEQLAQLSNQRINNNPDFKQIKQEIQTETAMRESQQTIPLKTEAFVQWAAQNKKDEMDEKETPPSKLFTAQNHKDDLQQFLNTSYSKTINDAALKNIQQDIYIEEAYQIITDFIKLQPKN